MPNSYQLCKTYLNDILRCKYKNLSCRNEYINNEKKKSIHNITIIISYKPIKSTKVVYMAED